MAAIATEETSNSATNTSYPEIILAAITALGEKDGSSKTAITEYIEANYADTLRERYKVEVSETLTKLQESGELLFANSLYRKSSLPNRGRGRPKKSKPTLPPGALPLTPRSRGRPPKQKDSQANAVNVVGGASRRRGRPTKPKDSNAASVKAVGGIPRRRGRPTKPKDSNAASVKAVGGIPRSRGRPTKPKDSNAASVKAVGGIPRSRGRPPKKHRPFPASSKAVSKGDETAPSVSAVKRGRGRPPKVK